MALSQLQERARFVGTAAANAGVQFDEERWLRRVRQTMERATAEELGAVAKVFDVPRALRATRPEAYVPQHFALGPYHHHRAELRDMECYKLAAAKRAENLFAANRKFDHLVQRFNELQGKIRAPYHRVVVRTTCILKFRCRWDKEYIDQQKISDKTKFFTKCWGKKVSIEKVKRAWAD